MLDKDWQACIVFADYLMLFADTSYATVLPTVMSALGEQTVVFTGVALMVVYRGLFRCGAATTAGRGCCYILFSCSPPPRPPAPKPPLARAAGVATRFWVGGSPSSTTSWTTALDHVS